MKIERAPPDDPRGEVLVFTYEPADIHPATHTLLRYECRTCGGCDTEMYYLYLCNSADDVITALSPLGYGAKKVPDNENGDEYAKRLIQEFFKELNALETKSGGILPENECSLLITELDKRVSFASPGSRINSGWIESQGSIVTYFADEKNRKQSLAMLRVYCADTYWLYENSPDVATVEARLEKDDIFALPGGEDMIALAVNLFNKGLYEEIDVVDSEG